MVNNPKLAIAISDASWGELVRQLEYKCDWYGRNFIKIDHSSFTSRGRSISGNCIILHNFLKFLQLKSYAFVYGLRFV